MPTSGNSACLAINSVAPSFCPRTGTCGGGGGVNAHTLSSPLQGLPSSVSPGTLLPPLRVAVPGERRRRGSVSWGTAPLFVPHYAQSSGGWRKKSPSPAAPQNSPGRSDSPFPRARSASLSCAPQRPEPLTQRQTSQGHLSTCEAASCPAPHSGFLHLPGALSQCRSTLMLQVAGAEASGAGHLSRAPGSAPRGRAPRQLV